MTPIRSLASLARSLPLVAAVGAWVLIAEAGVQFWYGLHSSPLNLRWAVSWPESQPQYKPVPIAPEAAGMLRYNDGGGASWTTPDGHRWLMYFFHWLPGRNRSAVCEDSSARDLSARRRAYHGSR